MEHVLQKVTGLDAVPEGWRISEKVTNLVEGAAVITFPSHFTGQNTKQIHWFFFFLAALWKTDYMSSKPVTTLNCLRSCSGWQDHSHILRLPLPIWTHINLLKSLSKACSSYPLLKETDSHFWGAGHSCWLPQLYRLLSLRRRWTWEMTDHKL